MTTPIFATLLFLAAIVTIGLPLSLVHVLVQQ